VYLKRHLKINLLSEYLLRLDLVKVCFVFNLHSYSNNIWWWWNKKTYYFAFCVCMPCSL